MCVSASLLCQCVTGTKTCVTKKKLQCVFVCVLVRRQPDEDKDVDSLAHLLLSLAVGGAAMTTILLEHFFFFF